jgi:hypothetical protein
MGVGVVHVAEAALQGWTWRRLAFGVSIPAVMLGVWLYPDIQQTLMPTWLALALLLTIGAGLLWSSQPLLVLVLPLVASVLPSQTAGYIGILLALVFFGVVAGGQRLVAPMDSFDVALLAMCLWLSVSWVLNLGVETDAWSLPLFTVTFLSPWLLLWVGRSAPWPLTTLAKVPLVLVALAAAELAPALLKPAIRGEWGAYLQAGSLLSVFNHGVLGAALASSSADQTFGTTPSAHHLGVFLILAIAFESARAIANRRADSWLLLAGLVFVLLMTDAKHVVLAAILPALLFGWQVLWPAMPAAGRQMGLAALVLLLAGTGVRLAGPATAMLERGLWRPYFSLAAFNPKVRMVQRTIDRLAQGDLEAWMGLGPGSFASRAATIRATDVLYKEGTSLPGFIPGYTGEAYRAAAYDLYTSEIALTAKFRSGVLTNPFSSVVGIVAEFGLLGTILVGWLLTAICVRGWRIWKASTVPASIRAAGATVGFAVPTLVLLGLFDSYFEQPDVMAPIVVLGVVVLAAGRRVTGTA